MTEQELEKKARKLLARCMNRMGVKPQDIDLEEFWQDEGFTIMNMLEDGLDMAEIQTQVGDALKPFCVDY